MILVGNPAIDWHPFLWGSGKISSHFILQKLAWALEAWWWATWLESVETLLLSNVHRHWIKRSCFFVGWVCNTSLEGRWRLVWVWHYWCSCWSAYLSTGCGWWCYTNWNIWSQWRKWCYICNHWRRYNFRCWFVNMPSKQFNCFNKYSYYL